MLSALLGDNLSAMSDGDVPNVSSESNRIYRAEPLGGLLIGGGGAGLSEGANGGLAALDGQSEYERAYAPFPATTGELIHDPDFSLPTIAGSLAWRMFYYSAHAYIDGPFGYGRRASWPLRACVHQDPIDGPVVTVSLEREDGLGAVYVSQDGGSGTYAPATPRLFDSLYGSPTEGFTELRLDTGTSFVYDAAYSSEDPNPPTCATTRLSHYLTVHGQTVQMHYDDDTGLLDSIEEPSGRTIDYTYYPFEAGDPHFTNNRVQMVTDWASRTHTFTYDDGNLLAIEDPCGYFTTYGYDCYHHLTSIEDPNGYVTTFAYDDRDRVTMRNVDNRVGLYQYGGDPSSGQLITYIDPFLNTWQTTTDAQGNVTSIQEPMVTPLSPVRATRRAQYNPYGQPTKLTDAVNRITNLDYDVTWPYTPGITGRQTMHQEPQQSPNYYSYDPWGNLTTHTDPIGRITTYSYGKFPVLRQVVTVMDSASHITSYTYRSWGALESVETPLGFKTNYTWDDVNAVMTAEQNPRGGTRNYTYDDAGNRLTSSDEMGRVTTFTYDLLGRQTSSENGVGAVRTNVWDGVGNLIAHIDPLGHTTTYTYDALRNETAEVDAYGFRFTTQYDLKGRETGRLDPNGNTTGSLWDAADRRVGRVDGVGLTTRTQYDLARRPTAVVDTTGLSYRTNYNAFDAAGMSAIAQIAPTGLQTLSVYDAAGQLIATVDTVGLRTTYNYDAAGRLWSTQEPTGALTTTTYDQNGRSVEVMNALGYRATSIYDATSDLTQSIDPVGRIYTTTYDLSGLRTYEQAPDSTWIQRGYDAAGRAVTTMDYRGYATTTTYDIVDRVIAFTDEYSKIVTDVYSPIGLVSMSYDSHGNITTSIYDAGRRPTLQVQSINGVGTIATTQYDPANKVTEYLAGLDTSKAYQYDVYGRFVSTQTPLGDFTTIGYETYGRLGSQTGADSQTTSLIYDNVGRWAATEDPLGGVVTTNFDVWGRVCGYTDELGCITTFAMDLLDRSIAQTDALGFATSFAYDAVGRTIGRTNAQGAITTSVYDRIGNLLATENALGQFTTYGYDAYSRRITTQNPLGFVSSTVYDSYGRVSARIDANGNATTTTYDAWNRFWSSQNMFDQRTTTVYDPYGRNWATIDPLGYRTSTGYDVLSRVIAQMDADGYATTTTYDRAGRPWYTTDPLGFLNTMVYDGVGRVIGQIDALGYRTTTVYNQAGWTLATIDARGYATSYAYDLKGQQLATQDALGYLSSNVYDGVGQGIASVDPFGYRTTTIYDSLGRVSAQQNQLGYLTTNLYDILDRTIATEDALGRLTTTVYDAAGRTLATQKANGVFVTNSYDPVGNRLSWENGLGFVTSYSYDNLNRKLGWMAPLGRQQTLSYDAAGRLYTETDALGQITTHSYDGNGWELTRQLWDGQQFSFSYDARGSRLTAFDTTGLTTSAYDAVGRLQSVLGPDYPNAQPLTYGYDGSGHIVSMTGWFAGAFTYTYDGRGQLSSVADPGYPTLGTPGGTTTYTYDALGRVVTQQYANGATSTFAYDAIGRTLQVRHASSGTEIDRAFYAFDALGRPLHLDAAHARHTYTYDALDQLVSEDATYSGTSGTPTRQLTTYTYDAGDRRITMAQLPRKTTNYAYDAADQLTHVGSVSGFPSVQGTSYAFTYDANGRRIVRQDSNPTAWGSGPYLTTFTWDAAGRLSSFAGYPASASAGVIPPTNPTAQTFTYDNAGMRHGHATPDGSTDALLWNPADGSPLGWVGGASTPASSLSELFVQAPEGKTLRALGETRQGIALSRQYHLDGQGSVEAQTGGSGASSEGGVATFTYDAFGNSFAQGVGNNGGSGTDSGAQDNPLRYLGGLGYWQGESAALGLTYVRERWLDSSTGQWLSVDPVDSEPRYSYAHNSPTIGVDPSGMLNRRIGASSDIDDGAALVNASAGDYDHSLSKQRGPVWNLYKWIYTGDGYASDEVYQSAVSEATDTLQSTTQSINLSTDTNRKRIRNLIKQWAKGGGQIKIPANINNFGTILGYIHPLLPIKNVSISQLLRFDNVINRKIAAATQRARNTLPGWEQIFVPPYPGSQAALEYYAGFVWGLCDTLAGFVNLVQQVAGIFDLMFTIAESVDIWETLKEFAKAQWHTFLQHLGEAGRLEPFDQGEMAATILVNMDLFVIQILDLLEAAAQIAKAVGPALAAAKRAAGRLSELAQSGEGKVVEKIVNALERRGKKPLEILGKDRGKTPSRGEREAVGKRQTAEIVGDVEEPNDLLTLESDLIKRNIDYPQLRRAAKIWTDRGKRVRLLLERQGVPTPDMEVEGVPGKYVEVISPKERTPESQILEKATHKKRQAKVVHINIDPGSAIDAAAAKRISANMLSQTNKNEIVRVLVSKGSNVLVDISR